jgi:hypothetical protein
MRAPGASSTTGRRRSRGAGNDTFGATIIAAKAELPGLTSHFGRGRRQLATEADLIDAMDRVDGEPIA